MFDVWIHLDLIGGLAIPEKGRFETGSAFTRNGLEQAQRQTQRSKGLSKRRTGARSGKLVGAVWDQTEAPASANNVRRATGGARGFGWRLGVVRIREC